jgi:hypothetical protein
VLHDKAQGPPDAAPNNGGTHPSSRDSAAITCACSSKDVDDRTIAYIVAIQQYFDDLKQVAAQIAGLLVLAAAGGESAMPDHPLLEIAKQLHQRAIEGIHTAQATVRASPHYHHLLRAAMNLGAALSSARAGLRDIDSVLVPLQLAYAELRLAAKTLPGFEMVSFEQGCCAMHTGAKTA